MAEPNESRTPGYFDQLASLVYGPGSSVHVDPPSASTVAKTASQFSEAGNIYNAYEAYKRGDYGEAALDVFPFGKAAGAVAAKALPALKGAAAGLVGGKNAKGAANIIDWFSGPQGDQAFEMSDHLAKWTGKANQGTAKLPEVFDHPEVYEHYPHLKNVNVTYAVDPSVEFPRAAFNPKNGNITVHAKDANQAANKTLHEIQHHIDQAEGRKSAGSSPAIEEDKLIRQEMGKHIMQGTEPTDKQLQKLSGKAYQRYRRDPSEMTARAVQARQNLTPQERLDRPFMQHKEPGEPWDIDFSKVNP